VCEEGLAQSTDPQAGERDAELHRRDELRRLSGDLQHLARAARAVVRELVHAGAPDRDEAVLRGHEEAVQEDQRREGEKLERKGHARPSRA
jgi:hypothetical protein